METTQLGEFLIHTISPGRDHERRQHRNRREGPEAAGLDDEALARQGVHPEVEQREVPALQRRVGPQAERGDAGPRRLGQAGGDGPGALVEREPLVAVG